MKKVKYILAIVLAAILLPTVAFAKTDKVNVYIFRGEGCGYCARAIAYFRELVEDENYKDKFNVVTYEVWNNENNSKLMAAVADKLDQEVKGVPFIVIGETAFGGYASSYNEDIEAAIDDNYSSKNYKDVVQSVIDEGNYESKITKTTLDEIKESTTSSSTTTSESYDDSEKKSNTGIIIGVVCIVLGGLGALIYVSRS